MANTVHGPFVKGASLATGSYGTGVGQSNTYTSGNANNDETQSGVALASFNPDLVGAGLVQSGVACVKDVTTPTQLNITSGAAYLVMTDGTTARMDVSATTESTAGHPSATLFLDLNPDGTWSWATTHSAQANYLPICSVTTDGSSNISAVSDARVMYAQALTSLAHPAPAQPGGMLLPSPLALDLTQNAALSGAVVGGVTFGKVGALRGSMDGAAQFNGTTGYVNVPTSGLPTGNGAWSLEAWVYPTALPPSTSFAYALTLGTFSAGQAAWLGYQNNSGTLNPAILTNGGDITAGAASVPLNTWSHLAATYNGTTLTLYLNGASVGTATPTARSLTYGMATIGANSNTPPTQFLTGSIDEVAIYGAALSGARVSAHYSAATSVTSDVYATTILSDAPLRYYRLGDASGATSARAIITPTLTQILDAGGNATIPGALTALGGQASAGSLGVPVIVAQGSAVTVTDKISHLLLSFTPTVTGFYRATADLVIGPETGYAAQFAVNYTSGLNSTAQTQVVDAGVNPMVWGIYAKAGSAITINYQNNSTGTGINDIVIAILERLS